MAINRSEIDADEAESEAEARDRYGDLYPDTFERTDESHSLLSDTTAWNDTTFYPRFDVTETVSDEEFARLDFIRRDNALLAKSAKQWLADAGREVDRRPLFGDFWTEGEISFLMADSGMGKSLLAFQIAESIASGTKIPPFELGAKPQRVLLIDFELDDKQFELRYRTVTQIDRKYQHYEFSANLIRAKMGEVITLPDACRTLTEHIYSSIETLIRHTGARVVVIDNITWLNPSIDNATHASTMMKNLKYLKTQLNISILVIAHTPKRYKFGALELRDLQGSKMLANFADNIFGMGKSRLNKDLRYLKHLKSRNRRMRFDAAKVCTIRLTKQSGVAPKGTRPFRSKYIGSTEMSEMKSTVPSCKTDAFLGFAFVGYATELDHIGSRPGPDNLERQQAITKAKLLSAEGHSIRQIAQKTGIKQTTLHRHLKRALTK